MERILYLSSKYFEVLGDVKKKKPLVSIAIIY